jgi:hypothetical protein
MTNSRNHADNGFCPVLQRDLSVRGDGWIAFLCLWLLLSWPAASAVAGTTQKGNETASSTATTQRATAIRGNTPAGAAASETQSLRALNAQDKANQTATTNQRNAQAPASRQQILAGARVLQESDHLVQYGKTGGFAQANHDFNAMTRGVAVVDRSDGLRTAKLADGANVNVRPNSRKGQDWDSKPTFEIQPRPGTNERTIKIRYD